MDAYAFAAAMLALALLIGTIVGSLSMAYSMGAKSRDGELLVARAERDSALAESETRKASAGDGAAAADGLVKAATLAAAPAGSAGDLGMWGGAPGPAGGGAPAPPASTA